MLREVSIFNGCSSIDIDTDSVVRLFQLLDRASLPWQIPTGELSIAFVSLAEICSMHDMFLGDPEPTDVITFPGDPDEGLAGEICVCPEYAMQVSSRYDSTPDWELTLYLIHGWLHLAGLDDIDPIDRQAMRAAEETLMALVTDQAHLLYFTWNSSADSASE
jgi:probable rRNA maturation factor